MISDARQWAVTRGTSYLLSIPFGILCSIGCAGAPVGPPELVLPPGDAMAGRNAFVRLECTACHTVAGDPRLPEPTSLDVPFALGERSASRPTDARLVTSVINPSHSIRMPHRSEVVTESGRSRMDDYTSKMRVEELVDIVAYLRQAYDGGRGGAP